MNGRQLAALFKEHGGIKAIHTRPAVDRRTGRRGWANTYVCHDGFDRTLTPAQETALGKALEEDKVMG